MASNPERQAEWHSYDQFVIKLRKDAEINGDFLRGYAAAQGESVNNFVTKAVRQAMERDKQE